MPCWGVSAEGRGSGGEAEGGLSSGRQVGDVLLREDSVLGVSAGMRKDTSHEGEHDASSWCPFSIAQWSAS